MARRKTHEEFAREVFDLVGYDYSILGQYKNSTSKINIKHELCGSIYSVAPNNFLAGYRCPHCSSTSKKSNSQFIEEVKRIHGDVYNFLTEYTKNNEHIHIQHKTCGYKWKTQPTALLDKRKKGKVYCPSCNGRITLTTEIVKERLLALNGEYELIGEFTSGEKITVKHSVCEKEFLVSMYHLLENPKCYHCDWHKVINHLEFIEKVFGLVGNEYEVLSEYVNSSEKVLIRHNSDSCGYNEYYIRPTSFLNAGSRCSICSMREVGEKRKKSHQQFKEEICNLMGENAYEFLSDYRSTREKIIVKHVSCGYVWSVRANDLITECRKNREPCPKCSKKIPISNDEFKEKVFEIVGNEYIFIEEFIDYTTPIKIRHNASCSHEYLVKPSVFLNRGNRCQKCYFDSRRKKQSEFEKEVFELTSVEYKVVGKYKSAVSKIEFLHDVEECGNIFSMNPSEFLNGQRCPECSRKNASLKMRKTHDVFVEDVINIHGDVFDFLSEYQSSLGSMFIRHKECGYEWNVPVANMLRERIQGVSLCPLCSGGLSHGETSISNFLSELGITFIPQYTFDDCIYKLPLRFDFGIVDEENILKFLIEYDGRQHFEPIDYFGGELSLTRQKEKDQIKNKYCADNNIPLYRIPYWDFDNIEAILNEILKVENLDI